MTVVGTAMVALLALASLMAALLSAYAWRRRGEPGALPFAALMAALVVWAGAYAVGLSTTDPTLRLFWAQVEWFGKAAVPLGAVAFALEYTGHDDVLAPRTVAALAVVPAVTVLLVWTNPWHHLVWTAVDAVHAEGLVLFVTGYGPWFWISFLYLYALIAVGSVLILRLIFLSDRLYLDQSLLLLVGMVTPVVGNFASTIGAAPLPGLDMTPYTFTLTGLTYGYALFRGRLFALVPATRSLGRDAAIDQLEDGVVIANREGHIAFANAAAGDALGVESTVALGRPITDFVDSAALPDRDGDEPATIERDGRSFAVRTSPITDRSGRPVGRTYLLADVTARVRRERRLADQRNELARLEDLNAVVRGVNRDLVTARDREAIERAVCDRLADAAFVTTAVVGDVQTWTDGVDRWTTAGDPVADGDAVATRIDEVVPATDPTAADGATVVDRSRDGGPWVVVPLTYGLTVYGALGLRLTRDAVEAREREVLSELGETVGHAIDAVEARRPFDADDAVELAVSVSAPEDALAAAASTTGATLDVVGIVSHPPEGHLAFVRVADAAPAGVRDRLDEAGVRARVVREDGADGLLEVLVDDGTPLGPIAERGAHLLSGTAVDGQGDYTVIVPTSLDARRLLDRLTSTFPSTDLRAKREREHPLTGTDGIAADRLAALTDRQQEALEAAYEAGYFEWPRDADAQDVAESMDISSPTLHNHLRKAQAKLLADLFDRGDD